MYICFLSLSPFFLYAFVNFVVILLSPSLTFHKALFFFTHCFFSLQVRDELEHLLDDDMDMAEMYLSEKLARQQVGESLARGDNEGDEPKLDDDR